MGEKRGFSLLCLDRNKFPGSLQVDSRKILVGKSPRSYLNATPSDLEPTWNSPKIYLTPTGATLLILKTNTPPTEGMETLKNLDRLNEFVEILIELPNGSTNRKRGKW